MVRSHVYNFILFNNWDVNSPLSKRVATWGEGKHIQLWDLLGELEAVNIW